MSLYTLKKFDCHLLYRVAKIQIMAYLKVTTWEAAIVKANWKGFAIEKEEN